MSGPVLSSGGQLVDREREREVLDRLLDGGRGGRGGVLVVHGEAGVGKTALLEYAAEAGRGFRIARTSGVEAEMELPFAAVQQLCSAFLDLLDRLAQPQREALGVAFGLSTGPAPNPFLVGLAVLGLLSEAAEERSLLAVVDDAHWLDDASVRALAFVARRLLAEKIALVFAARQAMMPDAFGGLPSLHVELLGRRDARALLESVLPARLDEPVLERIVIETRGNPLALLELPRGLTPTELAGGFGLPAAVPLSASIEESFTRRLEDLPDDTRLLLLVAAAEPVGDPLLLSRAAEKLGISTGAAAAGETDGLLTLGEQVTFRHPLVRSAVYRSAPVEQRRAVHSALAEVTDRAADPDRRAWHLAAAASAPDEEVACELDRSAGSPDELQQAQTELLRGQIAYSSNLGSDAPPLLLSAARRLERFDVDLARETYLDAWGAAWFAGSLATAGDLREVSRAARSAPPSTHPSQPFDLLLDGLALLITEGRAAAASALRRASNAFATAETPAENAFRWTALAPIPSYVLWDDESWHAINTRQLGLAREAGALATLPMALMTRSGH